MTQQKQKEAQVEIRAQFEGMLAELQAWREAHPEATLDEIANEVTPRRRALMGKLLEQLALQHGDGSMAEGVVCPECGVAMRYKGEAAKGVLHLEGDMNLARAYYHCPHCERGLFPPG
jgi:hypothetical protein